MLGGKEREKERNEMGFLVAAELRNFIFLNKNVIGAKEDKKCVV